MNLGFTAEHESLRSELRKLLARAEHHLPPGAGAAEPADAALWQALTDSGWLGTAVPEAHGGSGLDGAALCVLAEEAGRALAAVPLVASACAFVHALRAVAEVVPAALWQGLAAGSARGVLLADDGWIMTPEISVQANGEIRVAGRAQFVPDGPSATHALLLAGSGDAAALVLATLAPANQPEPAAQPLDLLHPCCDIDLAGAAVQLLARGRAAQALWSRAVDAQALFVAFEQLGGADAALDAARRYSLQRYAFGRPVGSFQALKHLMADMLVAIDLARSNCLFGLAALAAGDDALGEAAAVARISATEAFRIAAAGSTQVHGALGVTWEADCHLFYRRAQALAGSPGAQWRWKDRLVQLLQQRAALAPVLTAPEPTAING
ncbi:acyl-CoA/acyl-ACP dehydrogenase [Aquincola sp. S2]|uniref:Acyl-CoA/acyl-ACP dehydrogenase n=1 Tax=Pseudaquabacterium terrae TaxID=2732868 RepID=A0ABX2EBU7_9BURK|nr:acyl-CoA dehydrogenase family protein [Aquabacterium terrae]NRF65879.1 acyl-CoA/acyl-ACP dehydrogenase [Aquabacterium terrae]